MSHLGLVWFGGGGWRMRRGVDVVQCESTLEAEGGTMLVDKYCLLVAGVIYLFTLFCFVLRICVCVCVCVCEETGTL